MTAPKDLDPASAIVLETVPTAELIVNVSTSVEDPNAKVPDPLPKAPTVILLPFVANVRSVGIVRLEGVKVRPVKDVSIVAVLPEAPDIVIEPDSVKRPLKVVVSPPENTQGLLIVITEPPAL
jgi:hypothetical protein